MKYCKNPLIIAGALIGLHYLDLLLSGHWQTTLLIIFGIYYLLDLLPRGVKQSIRQASETIFRVVLNLRYLIGSGLLSESLKTSVQRAIRERQEIAIHSDHDGPISPEGADFFKLKPSIWILAIFTLLRAIGVRTAIVTGRGLKTILRHTIYRVAFEAAVGALGYEYCGNLSSGFVENKPVDRKLKTAFTRMMEDINVVVEEGGYEGFGMDVRGDVAGINCFVSNVQGGLERQHPLFAAIEEIVRRHFLEDMMDVFYHRPGQSEQPRIDVHIKGLTKTGKGEEVKELCQKVHTSALTIIVADDVPGLLNSLVAGAHEVMDEKGGSVFGIEVHPHPKRLTFERHGQCITVPGQVGYFLVLWQLWRYIRRVRRLHEAA
jgi:hypothetical protein